jgi:glycosyltransferase involved in cell wall biosynthesis
MILGKRSWGISRLFEGGKVDSSLCYFLEGSRFAGCWERRVRILAVLKYIPSQAKDLKGDLLWSLIQGLEAAGNEVVLLTDGRTEKHERPQIVLRYGRLFKWLDRLCNKIAQLSGVVGLEHFFLRQVLPPVVRAFHRQRAIDVVLAECTSDSPAIIAHRIHQILGIPFVVREHKNYESRATTITSLQRSYISALRAAAKLIAVSEGQADTIRKSGIRDDLEVIDNPLSDAFFVPPTDSPSENLEALRRFSREGIVFGAWTRWRTIKRLDLLIEAFAKAHARNNSLRLVIAGPIESPPDIDSLIKQQQLGGCVLNWGLASREEIQRIAFAVDCVVVPSDFETFALPVIEGMAAGKPAIVTRCNGPEGLVCDKRLGRVVDRGSSAQLADAMGEVAASIDSFDAAFIRGYASARYSASHIGERYSTLLANVIGVAAKQQVRTYGC